jgi:alkaline phosphatase D
MTVRWHAKGYGIELTFPVPITAWDGYQKERLDILNYAYDSQLNNTVIVTGDTHANWVFENNLDNVLKGSKDTDSLKPVQAKTATYQRGQIVEFGGTAVSSNGWGNGFLNERNATEKGAAGLVRDSAGLLWSEGFCE